MAVPKMLSFADAPRCPALDARPIRVRSGRDLRGCGGIGDSAFLWDSQKLDHLVAARPITDCLRRCEGTSEYGLFMVSVAVLLEFTTACIFLLSALRVVSSTIRPNAYHMNEVNVMNENE